MEGSPLMATNLVYRNTDSQNRTEVLAATHDSGKPVLSKAGLPAVTVTPSGDHTRSETRSDGIVISNIPNAGAGLVGKEVTLAFDGTWEFPTADITGVTAASAAGTAVYITSANALTNVETGNTLFGYIDLPIDYDRSRGFTPIRIGA